MKKDTSSFMDDEFAGQRKEFRKMAPKIVINGIQGSLEARHVKCGRANCKCAKGELHGPYFYHRYRSNGHRRRRYVKESELEALRAGIEEYQQQRAQMIEANKFARGKLRQMKAQFRDLARRMRDEGFSL